jgi:hypothetical protein
LALKFKNPVRTYTRFVLGGVGGIGKSTALGTVAKKALVLDLNKRWPKDRIWGHEFLDFTDTFSGIKDKLNEVLAEAKLPNDWFIIDTGTDLMRLTRAHIISVVFGGESEKYNAFQNGDKNYAPQYMNEILSLLDKIAEKHGMNIGLICHTIPKDQKNPLGKDYSKQALHLPDLVAATVLQWADYVGYAYNDVIVAQDGLKQKAKSQVRKISFNDNPCYDAKNGSAFVLPEKIDFDKEGKWADLVFGKRPLVNELESLFDQYPEETREGMKAKFEGIGFRTMPDDALKGLIVETKNYLAKLNGGK